MYEKFMVYETMYVFVKYVSMSFRYVSGIEPKTSNFWARENVIDDAGTKCKQATWIWNALLLLSEHK